MPITIRCPRCGEIRFVEDTDQSSIIACTGCNASLRIPMPAVGERSAAATIENVNPFADHSVASKPLIAETQNPYQAPTLAPDKFRGAARYNYGRIDPRLASRWKRFFGSLLDGLTYAVPVLLLFVILDGNDDDTYFLIALGVMGLVMVINGILITTRGQSIGKMILGMQIVKADTDELPGFVHGVLLRSVVPVIINQIPFVGGIFGLVDPLFIFGDDRQCLHDKMAGTKVLDQRLMTENVWDDDSHKLRPFQPKL